MSSDEFDQYDFSEFTEKDLLEIDAQLARAHPREVQIATQDSPFTNFISWKKHLAVTDITSPIWCEIQYEYSLYGKRNKPLHLRPPSFTSRSGKQIHVHQQVASANDRRLKRGKSIHKALENELRPKKLLVNITSDEERFGLRLVQLIDGFTQLVTDGITRELPVFTTTHGQVITGVIDEVLCSPQGIPSRSQSASPASPPHKRQRLVSPPPAQPTTSNDSPHPYVLSIIDYKTRRSLNIPVDEESLSPRLQLMLYHRMLSSVLQPETINFHLLWSQLNLDPTKALSAQFLKDIVWEQRKRDPTDCTVDLDRLVSDWTSVVRRNRSKIVGVSRQLQLIYRRSEFVGRQGKHKIAGPVDIEDPLEALLLQEEVDLARAIEESLRDLGHQEVDRVALHVAHNIQQVGPTSVGRTSAVWKDLVSPSDAEQDDASLAWAIQQSLLICARKTCVNTPSTSSQQRDESNSVVLEDQMQSESTADISPIIGTREFGMDDAELDTHLTDVLQWWFGARPARGVSIGQTNRCFTCEFQDSCEWREKKAKEAATLASQRRAQQSGSKSDSTSNSIWLTRPEPA